VNVNFPILM